MTLITEIEDEIKEAMKARDAERRDALRLIVNSLKNSQKELQRPLSEEEELQVLQRERKRRVEAAEAFRGGGQFVHAPHTGTVVQVASLSGYYASNLVGARRVP